MALPIVIAKNQTLSSILLPRLGITVPASGQTTLTNFAAFYELSWENELQVKVTAGDIIVNDGVSDLSSARALAYLQAIGNLVGPVTGLADNILIRMDGTTGRYTKSTSITVDDSNNVDLGSGDLTTTGALIPGIFIFPTALAPTPTTEGQVIWDTDDDVLRVGNGLTTTTLLTDGTAAGGDLSGTLPNPTVVDLTITGEQQGSVLYFNGSNWVQLPPGTSGQFLRTSGVGANPTWSSAAGGVSLQNAYDTGNSIVTAAAVPILFTLTSGGFTVNGTGAIDIGSGATTQTLNVGAGAGAKTITVGNTTGATTVNLAAGTGNTNITTGLALNGVLTPAALTVNTNDYNPAGLSGISTIRLSSTANVNLSGLQGGVSGRIIIITNVGTFAITFLDDSGLSSAANRFDLRRDVRLNEDDSIILQYDATSSRWRAPATSDGTVSGITKNRFYQFAANASTNLGDHNTVSVGANGILRLEFQIPDDFTTLVSIQAIMVPGVTNATANIDLASDYAGVGELFNANSESNTTITFALTINVITGLDLSSVFSSLAVGDFGGVTITQNAIGATSFYFGTLLRYT